MTMPFGRKLGMEVSSRVAVVGLVVLALDTSCNPRREHTEVTQGGQGPQADRESKVPSCRLDPPGDGSECILPRSCVGVPGYCFVLKEEHRPGSATEATTGAEEHTGLGDPPHVTIPGTLEISSAGSHPFPYFKCKDSGCGFNLNSSNSTGVFPSYVRGSLQIDTNPQDLVKGTSWGWCAVSDSGAWQDHSFEVGGTFSSTSLDFPVEAGKPVTTYRFRIWGVESPNRAIAGDPKIKAVGSSTDPVATFPPPIPVCPKEYEYYRGCLPGQYDSSCPSVLKVPENSSFDGSNYTGGPLNISSPFWLYRTSSNDGDPIAAADQVRQNLDQTSPPDLYGPSNQFNPLDAKLALSSDGIDRNIVFYNINTLANYATTVTDVPTLPAMGATAPSFQWRMVSYQTLINYTELYDSTAGFLNCLTGIEPTMVRYSQVAATDMTTGTQPDHFATVSILFPYPSSDTSYETCAKDSKKDHVEVFCDGGSC